MDASHRILDANFNRAREALRVLEDYARFGLDDMSLAQVAKSIRHSLADATRRIGGIELAAARDIVGDVGRAISTEQELTREGLADVVVAAGKRLTESLRVIEEVGKTRDRDFAAAVEGLRYSAYDLEKRLAMRINPAAQFERVKLYVIVTESLCAGDWLATADAALRGGADVIQLREKGLADGELLRRARELARLCHETQALCIINDRPDVAALAVADGVHVGQEDLPVQAARRVMPPGRIVGVSTHSPEQVRVAASAAPDYVAVGPMFPTSTKSIAEVPGPAFWEDAGGETSIPRVAIGGITPGNLPRLVERGCRRVCVCQAVIGQRDARAAARELRRILDGAGQSSPVQE